MQREKRWNPGCQFKVEDLLAAVETIKEIQYQEEKMNVSDKENYITDNRQYFIWGLLPAGTSTASQII